MQKYLLALMLSAGLAVSDTHVLLDDGPTLDTCFWNYNSDLEQCNNFEPETDPAHIACVAGALQTLAACFQTEDNIEYQEIQQAFQDHLSRLAQCKDRFGDSPSLYAACVDGSLLVLQEAISRILGDDAASSTSVTGSRIPAFTVNDSPRVTLADHRGEVALSTESNNTAKIASLLLLTYDTSEGATTKIVSHTVTAGKQVDMTTDLATLDLRHANLVAATVFHIAANGKIIGLNGGVIELLDSDIRGDWNRDGIRNDRDLTDFLEGFTAETNRSDINNDDAVDLLDMIEFLSDFTSN